MVYRVLALLVCGLYMLPVTLLALACIFIVHVVIFDAVRHIGRRREPNA